MKIRNRFNSTTPARELTEFRTPSDKVFVVYHLGVPEMDAATWRLAIGGRVEKPASLSLADLQRLPMSELTAFHECAGSPLKPTVPVRRVSNVLWRGVRLQTLLDKVGVRPEARYVWARGADSGIYPPTGVHNDSYVKDLPLQKALDDALLATHMNGAPLSEEHGAPVRLVVPGYYGTSSVKWLTEIRLEPERADSYFTSTLYNDRHEEDGVEHVTPVWAVAPNCVIVSPATGEQLARRATDIWGWAWGANEIVAVDISTDGGSTWIGAALDKREGLSWQRFSLRWTPTTPGAQEIVARATDASGARQPCSGARSEVFKLNVNVDR